MRLLLDEMHPPALAQELRLRGHDVVSIHEDVMSRLQGSPDHEVWVAAIEADRTLVTENVQDFRPIEAEALAAGERTAGLIFTTDRRFPRGDPRTLGRLVRALDALLRDPTGGTTNLFLRPADQP